MTQEELLKLSHKIFIYIKASGICDPDRLTIINTILALNSLGYKIEKETMQ